VVSNPVPAILRRSQGTATQKAFFFFFFFFKQRRRLWIRNQKVRGFHSRINLFLLFHCFGGILGGEGATFDAVFLVMTTISSMLCQSGASISS
jgi:hypothetical protein